MPTVTSGAALPPLEMRAAAAHGSDLTKSATSVREMRFFVKLAPLGAPLLLPRRMTAILCGILLVTLRRKERPPCFESSGGRAGAGERMCE